MRGDLPLVQDISVALNPRQRHRIVAPVLRVSLVGLVLVVFWATPRARAQEQAVASLEVVHDESSAACVEREDLALRVASRMGRDPFVSEATLRFRVRASRVERETLVVLEMLDATGVSLGTREWRRRRCDGALRAEVALALTLLVRDAPEPPPPPTPPPPPPPEPPPPTPTPVVVEAPPPQEPEPVPVEEGPSLRLELAAFAVALFETAPSVTAGLGIDVGLRIGDVFSVGLEGRFDLPASGALAGGGRDETAIVLGAVYGCARYVYVGGCVVGGAGALRATGQDLASVATATTTYATVGARLFGEIVLGPVVLHLRFDVLPAIVRTSLRVSGETVWTLPAVGFALGGGVGAIF